MSAAAHKIEITPPLGPDQFAIKAHDGFRVVRDDLIPGGTKSRTLERFLPTISPNKELVYSATPFGYGQKALALIGKKLNRNVTIFGPKLNPRSEFLKVAQENGAQIVEVHLRKLHTFSKVEREAQKYFEAAKDKRFLLKSGFDSQSFINITANIIRDNLKTEDPITEVWCVAGSGALSRSLQEAWPDAKHHIVRVRSQDSIYGTNCNPGKAEVHDAEETFDEEATEPPPFPSSRHYEAKLWKIVKEYGAPNALVWNM